MPGGIMSPKTIFGTDDTILRFFLPVHVKEPNAAVDLFEPEALVHRNKQVFIAERCQACFAAAGSGSN